MKQYSLDTIVGAEIESAGDSRLDARRFMALRRSIHSAGKTIAAVALTCAMSCVVPLIQAASASGAGGSKANDAVPTSEVQLVIDYNTFIQTTFTDWEKQRPGLPKFITNATVLHEAPSLPWGGTMVGYEGWHRLNQKNVAILKALLPNLDIAPSKYFQSHNIVIHEYGMIIKATPQAPTPFVMPMVEKYTIENGRITEIDEFYEDTAGLLQRLTVLGILQK